MLTVKKLSMLSVDWYDNINNILEKTELKTDICIIRKTKYNHQSKSTDDGPMSIKSHFVPCNNKCMNQGNGLRNEKTSNNQVQCIQDLWFWEISHKTHPYDCEYKKIHFECHSVTSNRFSSLENTISKQIRMPSFTTPIHI